MELFGKLNFPPGAFQEKNKGAALPAVQRKKPEEKKKDDQERAGAEQYRNGRKRRIKPGQEDARGKRSRAGDKARRQHPERKIPQAEAKAPHADGKGQQPPGTVTKRMAATYIMQGGHPMR